MVAKYYNTRKQYNVKRSPKAPRPVEQPSFVVQLLSHHAQGGNIPFRETRHFNEFCQAPVRTRASLRITKQDRRYERMASTCPLPLQQFVAHLSLNVSQE